MNSWDRIVRKYPRFESAEIKNLGTDQKKAIAQKCVNQYFTDRVRKSFVLSGRPGTGKSFVAFAYLHDLIKRGGLVSDEIRFINEADLAEIALSGFERQAKLNRLLFPQYTVFVVEDVGGGAKYGFGANEQNLRETIWQQLVAYAYTNLLSLIVLTRLDEAELSLHLGKTAWGQFNTFSHGFYRLANSPEYKRAESELNEQVILNS